MARTAFPAAAVATVLAAGGIVAAGGTVAAADETPVVITVDAPRATPYYADGVDRPFWWESDGLHFKEPIPANGYVNINVPGASNLSIDTNRDLIGETFIPWNRFGLTPGMCVTWTESNGYAYHFGEDNTGRGGVDEKGWSVCVPTATPTPPPPPAPPPAPVPNPEAIEEVITK